MDNKDLFYSTAKKLFATQADKMIDVVPGTNDFQLVWQDDVAHYFIKKESGHSIKIRDVVDKMRALSVFEKEFFFIQSESTGFKRISISTISKRNLMAKGPFVIIHDKQTGANGITTADRFKSLDKSLYGFGYSYTDRDGKAQVYRNAYITNGDGEILDGRLLLEFADFQTEIVIQDQKWYDSYVEKNYALKDGIHTLENCYRSIIYSTGTFQQLFFQDFAPNCIPTDPYTEYMSGESIKKKRSLNSKKSDNKFLHLDKIKTEDAGLFELLLEYALELHQFEKLYLPKGSGEQEFLLTISELSSNRLEDLSFHISSILNEIKKYVVIGKGNLKILSSPSKDTVSSKKEFLNTFYELLIAYPEDGDPSKGWNPKIGRCSKVLKGFKENGLLVHFEVDEASNRYIDQYKPKEVELAILLEEDLLPRLFSFEGLTALLMRMMSLEIGSDGRIESWPVAFSRRLLENVLNSRGIKSIQTADPEIPYSSIKSSLEFLRVLFGVSNIGYVSRYKLVDNSGAPLKKDGSEFSVSYVINHNTFKKGGFLNRLKGGEISEFSLSLAPDQTYGGLISEWLSTYYIGKDFSIYEVGLYASAVCYLEGEFKKMLTRRFSVSNQDFLNLIEKDIQSNGFFSNPYPRNSNPYHYDQVSQGFTSMSELSQEEYKSIFLSALSKGLAKLALKNIRDGIAVESAYSHLQVISTIKKIAKGKITAAQCLLFIGNSKIAEALGLVIEDKKITEFGLAGLPINPDTIMSLGEVSKYIHCFPYTYDILREGLRDMKFLDPIEHIFLAKYEEYEALKEKISKT